MNRKRKEIPLVLFMSVGIPILFIAVIISVAFGAVRYDPIDILRLFALKTRLINSAELPGGMEMAVLMIRMPRVISAVVAGAGLAISGAVMQGVFRNPLAEPGLLGVSSGSGLGTLIAMSTGIASFYILPAFAFAGAMTAVGIILILSVFSGARTSTVTLIMSGMAVSAMFGALISVVLTVSNQYQVSSYIFWTMGGLVNRRWEHVAAMFGPVVLTMVLMVFSSRKLDVLLLGDEEAKALGINPMRTRIVLILLASACTASIVAVTGPIGFVGLIVPHIIRILVGPGHRNLVICSALAGSIFLLLSDFLARMLSIPIRMEFSCGVITALLGAPYFIFLLVRNTGRSKVF